MTTTTYRWRQIEPETAETLQSCPSLCWIYPGTAFRVLLGNVWTMIASVDGRWYMAKCGASDSEAVRMLCEREAPVAEGVGR